MTRGNAHNHDTEDGTSDIRTWGSESEREERSWGSIHRHTRRPSIRTGRIGLDSDTVGTDTVPVCVAVGIGIVLVRAVAVAPNASAPIAPDALADASRAHDASYPSRTLAIRGKEQGRSGLPLEVPRNLSLRVGSPSSE